MEFTTYTLPNGIRGIHRRIKGNVTHCALLVNCLLYTSDAADE